MTNSSRPNFSIGEVAILQPPHPSACHLWGQETTILQIFWNESAEDAMGGNRSGWSYYTDVPAPPPTDLPEDQHSNWVWCEYDLCKKYDPGESFESLIEDLKVTV
jgi:hypothetical protein